MPRRRRIEAIPTPIPWGKDVRDYDRNTYGYDHRIAMPEEFLIQDVGYAELLAYQEEEWRLSRLQIVNDYQDYVDYQDLASLPWHPTYPDGMECNNDPDSTQRRRL